MILVENLIYSPRKLAWMRSTLRNRIYLFRSRSGIDRKMAGGMRADAARFRKTERIVIGDEDGFPEHARGKRAGHSRPRESIARCPIIPCNPSRR
jgi:hypothetical protein